VPGDATVPMRDSTDSAPLGSATTETARLRHNDTGAASWKYWGPYLSARQWGTVRENYSPSGKPWEYLPHDHARSRAYRWGEDGIAGFSDVNQYLCLAVTLWNGHDEILKERLFGLTNSEGNHGEDVKELYYYLDATPSHSDLKMLYKYPQAAFPYRMLVEENQRRATDGPAPQGRHQQFHRQRQRARSEPGFAGNQGGGVLPQRSVRWRVDRNPPPAVSRESGLPIRRFRLRLRRSTTRGRRLLR
jgi:hypothetical protein